MSTPVRRVLPPIWLLLAMLASYALDRWLPLVHFLPVPWNFSGLLPLGLGSLMSFMSAGAFRRAGTPVIPFETSTRLVTSGWFRVTRNPMYLGLVLVQAGVGMLMGSLGAFVPLPILIAILHLRFIRGEERFLEGIFGEEYLGYRSRVRRWL
jgi:protein-S-isoprenylcysteine O-methyltransferase Ste14